MKKILVTMLGLVAGATFVHAQGLVEIAARPAGSVQTNTSSFYLQNPGSQVRGAIPTQATVGAAYDFALLIASTTTAGDSSPLGADWSQAQIFGGGGAFVTASNSVNLAGGVSGSGGISGVGVTGWAPGTAMNVMLVGWSAGLGSSWSQVAGLFQAGLNSPGNYFGFSGIANIISGGSGSPASPPTSIFGAGIQGFDLFSAVQVPEPTTLALAGLGGISMLFLRRRKA
jgi:hypothetical protein